MSKEIITSRVERLHVLTAHRRHKLSARDNHFTCLENMHITFSNEV